MESALTPREIQTRMRAGASIEEVAELAGVPVNQIEAFAAPVIAERNHVVGTALQNPLRRAGKPSAHRSLHQIVETSLAGLDVDFEDVAWDSWLDRDKIWMVQASWGEDHQALFAYDIRARFSTAANDEARDLVDDRPEEIVWESDPDNEPTVDLNDEWAIARTTVGEPTDISGDNLWSEGSLSDSYEGVELQEVDGTYELVPSPESQIDVLYEMMSAISEDSVRVFEGLDAASAVNDVPDFDIQPAEQTDAPKPTTPTRKSRPRSAKQATPRQKPASPQKPASQVTASAQTPVTESEAAPQEKPEEFLKVEVSASQDPLVEVEQPKPTRKTRRRKRASVPSWDEIMFGGPLPDKDKDK